MLICTCLGIPALQFLAAHIVAVTIIGGVTLASGGLMIYDMRRNFHNQRQTAKPPAPEPVKVARRTTLHNDAWWAAHGTPVNIAPQRDAARARRVIDDYNRDANRVEQEWFPVPDENAFAGEVPELPAREAVLVDAWISRAMANERRG